MKAAIHYVEHFLLPNGQVCHLGRVRSDWVLVLECLMNRAVYFNSLGVAIEDFDFEAKRKFANDSVRLDGGLGDGIDPLTESRS